MQCKNHPDAPAKDRCVGCAEPFCGDCLVEVSGQRYCASCKVLVLRGREVFVEEATLACKEANEALTYAILSLFCCGLILGPIAILKANKARESIAANPRLTGSGKATAAIIIAIVALVCWAVGTFSRARARAY